MNKIINYKKAIKGLIIFTLFWYSNYIMVIPIKLLQIDISNKTIAIIINLLSDIIFLLFLLIVYHKDLKKEFKIFKKNIIENLDSGLQYWMLGLLIMIISNFILQFIFHTSGANNENAIRSLIKVSPIIMLINASIIAPINEEIVFRKTLYDAINNKWIFVISSFILFGSAHVLTKATTFTDYLYIIPYGALGLVFALTYKKTNTIFTSLFYHMLHNTILTSIVILSLK